MQLRSGEFWNEGDLSRELEVLFRTASEERGTSVRIGFRFLSLAIAPAKFWEHRMLKASGGQSKFPTLLGKRQTVVRECSDRGFPIEFVSFKADTSDEVGLPIITDIEPS